MNTFQLRTIRPAVWVTAALVALALVVTTVVARLDTQHPGAGGSDDTGILTNDGNDDAALGTTVFRTASFNLLGAGHTPPYGPRKKYKSGVVRMGQSVKLIEKLGLEVVGLQEMHKVQYEEFMRLRPTQYGIYPGKTFTESAIHNSIIWRKDTWTAVSTKAVKIPYFHNSDVRMPYVLLQHNRTGRKVWFANFHNPANTHGDASKDRAEAMRREVELVNRLRRNDPEIPVIFTGDFNEREKVFCRFASESELRSAGGGSVAGNGRCAPPAKMPVDWVFGTPDTQFTGYEALRDATVQKLTDHPVVIATANVAPLEFATSRVQEVVVVAVDGLSGGVVGNNLSKFPQFQRLAATGASTFQARTVPTSSNGRTNLEAVLTGRDVRATGYAASLFDVSHDASGRTVLAGTGKVPAELAARWNERTGAPDTNWTDNGRRKIDQAVTGTSGPDLVERVIGARKPAAVTVVHLSTRTRKGGPKKYGDRVREVDAQIRRIWNKTRQKALAAGRPDIMFVVVGTHGADPSAASSTRLRAARVPVLVRGPGLAAGSDLYDLNPSLTRPGSLVPGAGDPAPLRTSDVANLVTRYLQLAPVPGSTSNARQALTVTMAP